MVSHWVFLNHLTRPFGADPKLAAAFDNAEMRFVSLVASGDASLNDEAHGDEL